MRKIYMTPKMEEEKVEMPIICELGDGTTPSELGPDDTDTKSRHAFDDEAAIASMNGSAKMSLW